MEQIKKEILLEKMQNIITKLSSKEQAKSINPMDTFAALGLDEFDFIELVMLLEEAFDIIINDQLFTIDADINSLVSHILVSSQSSMSDNSIITEQ